jgi:hypothetical protein
MKTMRKSVSLYAAFFRDPPLKKKECQKEYYILRLESKEE